jgi:DNA-binding NarL/FixJ family response regulator
VQAQRTDARVLLADHDAVLRRGVRETLERDGLQVCAEAADASAAVAAAVAHHPTLCLLAVHLPGGGLAAMRAIVHRCPDTAVVVLTHSESHEDLAAALSAGASGYLLKSMGHDRLVAALLAVTRGEAAFPRHLLPRALSDLLETSHYPLFLPVQGRNVRLTRREWEVARHLVAGTSTGGMASALGISPVTVRRHVARLLEVLDVDTRAEALTLLEEAGAFNG